MDRMEIKDKTRKNVRKGITEQRYAYQWNRLTRRHQTLHVTHVITLRADTLYMTPWGDTVT